MLNIPLLYHQKLLVAHPVAIGATFIKPMPLENWTCKSNPFPEEEPRKRLVWFWKPSFYYIFLCCKPSFFHTNQPAVTAEYLVGSLLIRGVGARVCRETWRHIFLFCPREFFHWFQFYCCFKMVPVKCDRVMVYNQRREERERERVLQQDLGMIKEISPPSYPDIRDGGPPWCVMNITLNLEVESCPSSN